MVFAHQCETLNLLAFWVVHLKLAASEKHCTKRDISWEMIDKEGVLHCAKFLRIKNCATSQFFEFLAKINQRGMHLLSSVPCA